MPWGVVAGAAIGLVGSAIQADAAGDAADTQAASSAASIAEQRRQFDVNQANYKPFVDTAHRLLPQYEAEINKQVTPAEVMSDPGYQFGMDQGQQALSRKAAAQGGRVSGASLKQASRYATDYASTGYQAAFARREARLARLSQLAGMSPITAAANSGQQSANAISSLLSSGGDAAAAAQLAQGNIWGGAANQIGAAANRYFNQPSTSSGGGSSGGGGTWQGGDIGGIDLSDGAGGFA